MRITRPFSHVALALALLSPGCGSSSSSSVTSPTAPTSRCTASLAADNTSASALGGSGSLTIDVNRECSWQARSEASWITLTSAASGQGSGKVTYSVAENTSTTTRRGALAVNDQRVEVAQAGADCRFQIDPTAHSFPSDDATHVVQVVTQAGCAWTAASDVGWITVASGASGTGSGGVGVRVSANTGPPRSGTVRIAGQLFTAAQGATGQGPAPVCAYTVGPAVQSFSAGGGTGAVAIGAEGQCAWSAERGATWVAFTSPTSGSGQGSVAFQVAPNSGAARSTTITVAGQSVAVTQADGTPAPCAFSLPVTSTTIGAAGGSATARINAGPGCAWTAVSNADWLTITTGSAGTGTGQIGFTVTANTTTSERSTSIVVAGLVFSVVQAAGTAPPPPQCTFTLSSTAQNVPAGGGSGEVAVTASATSCPWTAVSNVDWLTVTAGATATGNGTVRYTATANTATAARTATLTIAGRTVTIEQPGAAAPPPPPPPTCTFTLSTTAQSTPAEGGTGQVGVTASDSTCTWAATSNAGWLTITQGANNTGNGTVQYTAAANTSTSARTGTLTIAGQVVTIDQAGAIPPPPPPDIQVFGTMSNITGTCPAIQFQLGGRRIVTNAQTSFQQACDQFKDGAPATVVGTEQLDGTVLAKSLRRGTP